VHNNLKQHKKYNEIKDHKLLLAYEIRKSRCTFRYDNLSPTLTAKMGTGGNNVPVLVNQMRKLTTRECLRIQGFPDSYQIEPNKAQSYKQIGNSVSVPVLVGLARRIFYSLN
jgi:DNA (cytosine-5)-methyltransferase 1